MKKDVNKLWITLGLLVNLLLFTNTEAGEDLTE
jgi:hypothetical protein